MEVQKGEIVRILARYAAAVLVTKGFIAGPEEAGLTQLLELALGAALTVAAEGWFYISKRVKKE